MALVVVLLAAGCISQQPDLSFADFGSLKGAEINRTKPAIDSAEITPPKDFMDAMNRQNIYWKLNENGTTAVTVWMFDYSNPAAAKSAVNKAYTRLQTQKGFPTYASKYGEKGAAGVTVYTVSVFEGRVDVYTFSIGNMAFWVQQTDSSSEYVDQLALEIVRLGTQKSGIQN